MNAKIDKLVLRYGEKVLELTLEEAEAIRKALNETLNQETIVREPIRFFSDEAPGKLKRFDWSPPPPSTFTVPYPMLDRTFC